MPIVSAARGGVVGSGGGSLSPQAAAVADGTSGANMAVEAVGLLNNAGTFDRQREVSGLNPSGQAWVAEPTLQALLAQALVLLRGLMFAQTITNTLLGGAGVDYKPDLLAIADLLALATPGTPASPNTLQ